MFKKRLTSRQAPGCALEALTSLLLPFDPTADRGLQRFRGKGQNRFSVNNEQGIQIKIMAADAIIITAAAAGRQVISADDPNGRPAEIGAPARGNWYDSCFFKYVLIFFNIISDEQRESIKRRDR